MPDPARELGCERPALALIDRCDADDARLADLASTAVAAIQARLRAGDDPRDVVRAVVRIVFGAEQATLRLADPATIDRIAAETLRILDFCGG
ncbi:hypothetical protein AB0K00_57495 [Dactylosporangium sp. NPDC049525]|uniref:hypothetical protein n=1 Tax=Dactylosporangium sp. NPDC049525 TaxID=3154730 RepID=UPI0034436B7D